MLRVLFLAGIGVRKIVGSASQLLLISALFRYFYVDGKQTRSALNDFYSLRMVCKPSAKGIVFHRLGVKIALRHMAAEGK